MSVWRWSPSSGQAPASERVRSSPKARRTTSVRSVFGGTASSSPRTRRSSSSRAETWEGLSATLSTTPPAQRCSASGGRSSRGRPSLRMRRSAGKRDSGEAHGRSPDRDRRADRHHASQPEDVLVAKPDATVRDPTRHEVRPIRAVDADEAAGRPVGEHGRARAGPERDGTVERVVEVGELVPHVKVTARRRPGGATDADARPEDRPAVLEEGRREAVQVDDQTRVDRDVAAERTPHDDGFENRRPTAVRAGEREGPGCRDVEGGLDRRGDVGGQRWLRRARRRSVRSRDEERGGAARNDRRNSERAGGDANAGPQPVSSGFRRLRVRGRAEMKRVPRTARPTSASVFGSSNAFATGAKPPIRLAHAACRASVVSSENTAAVSLRSWNVDAWPASSATVRSSIATAVLVKAASLSVMPRKLKNGLATAFVPRTVFKILTCASSCAPRTRAQRSLSGRMAATVPSRTAPR